MKKGLIIVLSSLLLLTGCNKSKQVVPISDVILNEEYIVLNVNDKHKIDVTLVGGDENSVIHYFSTNTNVVSVNKQGYLTAIKKGEATVLVHANDIERTLLVRVVEPVVDNVLTRNGTLRFDIKQNDESSSSFYSPVFLGYTARDGLLVRKEENNLVFDMSLLDSPIEDKTTKLAQIRNNIAFMSSYISSVSGGSMDALANYYNKLSNLLKEMNDDTLEGYLSNHKETYYTYSGDDFESIGAFSNENDQYRYYSEAKNESEQTDLLIDLIKSLIGIIQNIDFANNDLLKIDYIELLKEIEDGDSIIPDDVYTVLNVLKKLLNILIGGSDIKKSSYLVDNRDFVDLSFILNDTGKKEIVKTILDLVNIPGTLINFVDELDFAKFNINLTLYKGDDGYTHVHKMGFDSSLNVPELQTNYDAKMELTLDVVPEVNNNLFTTINERNYKLRNSAYYFDKFYNGVAPFIVYSDRGYIDSEVDIQKASIASYLDTLSTYESLPLEVKEMLEDGYDEINIRKYLNNIENTVQNALNSLDFSVITDIDSLFEITNQLSVYKNWDLRLKEEDGDKYQTAYNIQKEFLDAFKKRLEDFLTLANDLSDETTDEDFERIFDEYSSILTYYQDFINPLVPLPNVGKYVKNHFFSDFDAYFETFSSYLVSSDDFAFLSKASVNALVNYLNRHFEDDNLLDFLLGNKNIDKGTDGYVDAIFGIIRSNSRASSEFIRTMSQNQSYRTKVTTLINERLDEIYSMLKESFTNLVKSVDTLSYITEKATYTLNSEIARKTLEDTLALETKLFGVSLSNAQTRNKIQSLIDLGRDF